MPSTTLIEDVELIAQTEKAILIEFDDDSNEPIDGVNRFWIPKSVIEESDLEEEGDIGDIEVQSWFVAKCDGLEDAIEGN